MFGHKPNTQVNHVGCNDILYLGEDRFIGANKKIYNVLTRYRNKI